MAGNLLPGKRCGAKDVPAGASRVELGNYTGAEIGDKLESAKDTEGGTDRRSVIPCYNHRPWQSPPVVCRMAEECKYLHGATKDPDHRYRKPGYSANGKVEKVALTTAALASLSGSAGASVEESKTIVFRWNQLRSEISLRASQELDWEGCWPIQVIRQP